MATINDKISKFINTIAEWENIEKMQKELIKMESRPFTDFKKSGFEKLQAIDNVQRNRGQSTKSYRIIDTTK